jgi:3-hydroxybutyryl-CoA dehydrogenase
MKIVVLGDHEAWEIIRSTGSGIEWIRAEDAIDFFEDTDADAYFNLDQDSSELDYSEITKPVFISSITATLSERPFKPNVIRINGWPGFLEKEKWEIAGTISPEAEKVLSSIGKNYIALKDQPGFISPRVIAMIINEAFYANGEGVSSEEDIDIAMKLGTNYPYGPFEWSKKIGLKNILLLLQTLADTDIRYTPAPALQAAVNELS